ncbi:MAG: hypothetical protein IT211_05985 [Armatimonadetes bacterium]|nr:hypothetical protein [Armatimonadota bacterium]
MMQMHFNNRSVNNPVMRVVIGVIVIAIVALLLLLLISVAGVALVVGAVLALGFGVRRLLLGRTWKRNNQEVIQEAEVIESVQKTTPTGGKQLAQ